jgi:hypothetical protein
MTTNTKNETKLTTPFYLDDKTLQMLQDYAKRRGIKPSTAIGYAVRSGLRRLEAIMRYKHSPKGQKAAQRQRARRG